MSGLKFDKILGKVRERDDNTFVFNQAVAATVWTITHNLGKFPSVTVVDSAGSAVQGAVDYTNENELTICFSAAFSGKAYLN